MDFLQSRQPTLTKVTPYKLCVALLLEGWRRTGIAEDEEEVLSVPLQKKDFIVMVLKMININSCPLDKFYQLVRSCDGACSAPFQEWLTNTIKWRCDTKIDGILDIVIGLKRLLKDGEWPAAGHQVSKTSTVGLWVRNMLVTLNAMSFSEICTLTKQFVEYVQQPSTNEGNLSSRLSPDATHSQSQIREIEEQCVGRPLSMNRFLNQFSRQFPDLQDINFRKMANASECGDPFAAIAAVHDYFDWSVLSADSGSLSAAATLAPLALAKLLRRQGSQDLVQNYILEAIKKNQESNNPSFLLHALLELFVENSDPVESEKQLAQLLKECPKHDLTALGVVAKIANLVKSAGRDYITSDDAEKMLLCFSEVLQSGSEEIIYLSAAIVATLSSACLSHGHWELSSLFAEKLLRFTQLPTDVVLSPEPVCIAACNLSYCQAVQGNYTAAEMYLNFCKVQFPFSSVTSKHWKLCESVVNFQRSLLAGDCVAAEKFCTGVTSFNSLEGNLKRCEFLMASRADLQEAVDIVESLRQETQEKCTEDLLRVSLVAADVYGRIDNIGHSMGYLVETIQSAKEINRPIITAMATTRLAHLYVSKMEMASEALQMIEAETAAFLWPPTVCAERLVVKAKCLIALMQPNAIATRNAKLEAVDCLNAAAIIYERLDATDFLRDLHYLKALVFHSLHMTAERNKCARQFKQLDEHKPNLSTSSVLL